MQPAQDYLTAGRSPFAGWAAFYATICLYYTDATKALSLFRSLDELYPAERYPILNGRVQWLLATALGVQGKEQEGLERNHLALRLLEEASGEQEAAFVHVLLAEGLDPLGEVEAGWGHRLQALEDISPSGDHRRIHAMLLEAAQALLRQGFAEQALTTLEEVLANADAWPEHPIARAEGLTQRVQTLLALDRSDEALQEIENARAVIREIPDSGTQLVAPWLDLYEGLARVDSEPQHAVSFLTAAFERQSSVGYEWDRPRYLAERAKAHLSLDDKEAARADLREATAFYERTRSQLAEAELKMGYFRSAQPAFEALIAMDLDDRERWADAFVTSEQARARFFLDRRLSGRPSSFPRPEEIAALLPEGTALVEYAVLPDQAVAWLITSESWRLIRLPERSDELEANVERLRRDLQRGAAERVIQATAAPLFDSLIRPLGLRGAESLIIIPDRFLLGLPFSVLYDKDSGSYLIERFTLQLCPSAAFVRAPKDLPGDQTPAGSALVVGAADAGTGTSSLPEVDAEAREVGALYSDAKLLVGPEATRQAFLSALPGARIVHVASHAVANAERPALSRLLLTPKGNDGAITASDVWQLDLGHIELVVVAACESMLGQAQGREALFGLAGGFLSAGVDAVVASLWRVEDEETAYLMAAFHRHYKQQRNAPLAFRNAVIEGLSPAAGRRLSPNDWATFAVLTGSSSIS